MEVEQHVAELVENSKKALHEIEMYNQEQVDNVVRVIAKAIYDAAEPLAKMAVEETQLGVYEDKVAKNRGKSRVIWNDLKDKKTVGIIQEKKNKGMIYVAKPMGVVAAITPCTNPIVTPMCNAMLAIKGRNSIIISPHPRAKKCSTEAVRIINKKLKAISAPKNLIQIISEPSIKATNELMQMCDVTLATGGMAMVKAAYSSGKPSFGVGAGNVQGIVDTGVDLDEVAKKMIAGRIFDNGIICSGEQSIIAHENQYDDVIEAFKANGAYYAGDEEVIDKFRSVLFQDGTLNPKLVGQTVQCIAETAGVEVPQDTRVIILRAAGVGEADVLCKEKMCPVMVSFKYNTFEHAIRIAQTNLNYEGKGHSCVMHSNNLEHIKHVGESLTVSRLVVNQPSSTGAGGSFYNGFAPTTTLGTGSWGNNSISENLTYKHLINVTRIGLYNPNPHIPTDEEIFRDTSQVELGDLVGSS